MWEITLTRQTEKFLEKEHISEDRILSLVKDFIKYCRSEQVNLDVRKMKGRWKGYHRIRTGKIRMILKMDVEHRTIVVDRVDYRGNVYR